MIATLREFYGLQPTPPGDLFQFFVWEILSERALPARRDLAWQALRRIPALTPDAMFRAPARDLLDAIGVAGPHREERLERIRAVVGEFKRHRDQLASDTLADVGLMGAARVLRRLDHVPPASRARALLFAAGYPVLPMDDDAARVIGRLMGTSRPRRQSARRWLAGTLRRDAATYREAIIYVRHHALHTCVKAGPHCGVCPLRDRCLSVERRDAPA